jgi:cytochrome c556
MWKKVAIVSFALWIASVGFIVYKMQYGNAVMVDQRMEISLLPEERQLVLGEMRSLLAGLKGIIKGLSTDDFELVKESAIGNGMGMAQDINPALMTKLPMSFKTMGMGVHKSFDELAAKIPGATRKEILKEVDVIMTSCVTCHSAFKITEKSE